MRSQKCIYRPQIAEKAAVHPFILGKRILLAVKAAIVPVALYVAGIGYFPVVEQGGSLQDTSLMHKGEGRIEVKGIRRILVFIERQIL